ncbi:hypothetical protein Pint_21182 [Pistacia integerrima]|uniref:Uncharacterized protein n=1 Tax=Pistacia integerrima TaxID=434235 RepID=A0ACC0XBI0_9ROSI|nr:hypothetical protein Pint_21182 [Pistacia integerrima]
MACRVGGIRLQSSLVIPESDVSEGSCIMLATCRNQKRKNEPSTSGRASRIGMKFTSFSKRSFQTRRRGWKIAFALDTGGISGNGGQESLNGDTSGLGSTRLGRIVSAGGRLLLEKLNMARKNFPMKIFLLLLGFYTANALATILGQTGDWDVLVAGIVVAAIEGIGMLMYRKRPSSSTSTGRLKSFVILMNYWKAGVILGLFVDAFKLGS